MKWNQGRLFILWPQQSALHCHRIYAQHTRYRRYHRDSYFQDHTPYGFLDCHNSTPPFHAIKKNDCHKVEITVPCSLQSTDTPSSIPPVPPHRHHSYPD